MARQRSGRRTDYSWSNFGDVALAQALSAGGLFGATSSAVLVPQTLMRVRGRVGVVLDTGGLNESVMVLCGLMAINTDALAGAAAPEIFTN